MSTMPRTRLLTTTLLMPLVMLLVIPLGMLLVAALTAPAQACSAFCLQQDEQHVFGKNYDWGIDNGLLMVNKRFVEKTAMGTGTGEPPSWISRFGSVTFNQYGRELPMGGINEVGLVVEVSWLDETRYPAIDDRPALSNLQWVQYQLDNQRTVAEVIASDQQLRITQRGQTRIHYLVADRSGQVATIEFLEGRLVAHTGASLPVQALTNNNYPHSLDFQLEIAQNAERQAGTGRGSLDRFARLAERMEQYTAGTPAVDYAFDMLANVAQGDYTKWSIVYDLANLTIHYRTLAGPARKRLELADLDFSCDSAVRVIDVNDDEPGNIVPRLSDYTFEANRRLLEQSFAGTSFLAETPAEAIEYLARYPEDLPCTADEMR